MKKEILINYIIKYYKGYINSTFEYLLIKIIYYAENRSLC